jgi:hypothetical protein
MTTKMKGRATAREARSVIVAEIGPNRDIPA